MDFLEDLQYDQHNKVIVHVINIDDAVVAVAYNKDGSVRGVELYSC